ncbi:hypothetical protein PUNSTDRAFT_131086 [Punctularia strigosozonata HHB-11173 SS5]|uniref:uncharacterized protein n=1 Tax=Punctularia strigosozonata (strain HHB-11173) TaxID=741275 RepID=UPI0004416D90|nr:uncharacterized protein PUNSTDRAFT_131086 [Punctularia strigosozonata HHB-11173 SS5]EIN12849.1 hypothetical protein PUNSTDRAFT_131086 [Punctularia strigosozonata HHB-11173 SS5]
MSQSLGGSSGSDDSGLVARPWTVVASGTHPSLLGGNVTHSAVSLTDISDDDDAGSQDSSSCEGLSLSDEGAEDRPIDEALIARFESLREHAFGLLAEYERRADFDTLVRSIATAREAFALIPEGRTQSRGLLNVLATGLLERYEFDGNVNAVIEATTLTRTALLLHPPEHPDHEESLGILVKALMAFYERYGRRDTLDSLINLHRQCLSKRPAGHPERDIALSDLANSLMIRYECDDDRDMLDSAIGLYRETLALHPEGHLDRGLSLNNLASALETGYEACGDPDVLDETIALYREALSLCPAGHPKCGTLLSNLANSLVTRYQHGADPEALDEALHLHRKALSLRHDGHPEHASSLSNLANGLMLLCKRNGDPDAMDEMIVLSRKALTLCPDGHPDRGRSLNDLATGLMVHYECYGKPDILDEVLTLHREALSLHHIGHADRHMSLNNLAICLFAHYERYGDAHVLDEIIALHREAMTLRNDDHPHHPTSLNNLANALMIRYRHSGDPNTLQEVIKLHRHALMLLPEGRPGRGGSLSNLAISLSTHYERYGTPDVLEEAIVLHREALALRPGGHTERGITLSSLALALRTHYQRFGDPATLKEANALHREALSLHPVGHQGQQMSLSNLANSLMTHYQRFGDPDTLDEVIVLQREALSLCPRNHPDRDGLLNNLANALMTHCENYSDLGTLEEVIVLHREALSLRSGGHPERSMSLNNLASALMTHHRYRGSPDTLREAIDFHREALSLRPHGHPDRGPTLSNLANSVMAYYKHQRDLDTLNEAITLCREALHITTEGVPDYGALLLDLYQALDLAYTHSRDPSLLTEMHQTLSAADVALPFGAYSRLQLLWCLSSHHNRSGSPYHNVSLSIKYVENAISYPFGAVKDRLRRAQNFLQQYEDEIPAASGTEDSASGTDMHLALLSAYETAIGLLPRIAVLGLDPKARLASLDGAQRIAVDASLRALELNRLPLAVELLEQGRAVFWAQALRLRTQFDSLPQDLSTELVSLTRLLAANTDHRANTDDIHVPGTFAVAASIRRQQSDRFEKLIQDVRAIPGFERFLVHEPFSSLSDAAALGPVVILIPGARMSHAIIIEGNHTPFHVELGNITREIAISYATQLRKDGVEYRSSKQKRQGMRNNPASDSGGHSDQESRPTAREGQTPDQVPDEPELEAPLLILLERLWNDVVRPVIDVLHLTIRTGHSRPRLTWMPTGPFAFLPVHAAGIYTGGEVQYCSQYVPRHGVKSLFVAEPKASEPGWDVIKGVYKEVKSAVKVIPGHGVTVIRREHGTPTALAKVVERLPDSAIVHLACHGEQNAEEPLRSAFKLGDGDLTIDELTKLNLPDAMFAYLSACETGKGDSSHPDEAIHLAAAMLFAGFRSIIATLWPMSDMTGPFVAEHVYRQLFNTDNDMVDFNVIPYALDEAVDMLRRGGCSAYEWATFMHIGA